MCIDSAEVMCLASISTVPARVAFAGTWCTRTGNICSNLALVMTCVRRLDYSPFVYLLVSQCWYICQYHQIFPSVVLVLASYLIELCVMLGKDVVPGINTVVYRLFFVEIM